MDNETLLSLHTNQRLLLQELIARGIKVELLVRELELAEARLGDHVELLLDRDSSACPYAGSVICADKYLTKKLLARAGIEVPRGEQFFADQREDALAFAASLPFPQVVKPAHGSHGLGCTTDCEDEDDVARAIDNAVIWCGQNGAFLIEEQRPGMEFRIFISRRGKYAVLHRDPASVVGDGRHSIRALCERESQRRMNPRRNCLCPIVLDAVVEAFLARQGLDLDSVPRAGSKVYLRRNSNVALGGDCEDFTAAAHPTFITLARRALEVFPGLPYAGVDVLASDISAPAGPGRCTLLEVNSNPGLHIHMRPARGAPQNVAAYAADMIFPETAKEDRWSTDSSALPPTPYTTTRRLESTSASPAPKTLRAWSPVF